MLNRRTFITSAAMKLRQVILPCVLLACLTGCRPATAPPPPLITGATSQADQDAYKTLVAVQATYNNLLASYRANPTGLANLKAPLDQVAKDYNIAEQAWQIWHSTATAANQTAFNSALAKVQSDLSTVPQVVK